MHRIWSIALISLILVAPLFATGASHRVLPSRLQQMVSVIQFLKSRLSAEKSFAGLDSKARFTALVEALSLFGLDLPSEKLKADEDMSDIDLALLLIDCTPPHQREVLIKEYQAYIQDLSQKEPPDESDEYDKAFSDETTPENIEKKTEKVKRPGPSVPEDREPALSPPRGEAITRLTGRQMARKMSIPDSDIQNVLSEKLGASGEKDRNAGRRSRGFCRDNFYWKNLKRLRRDLESALQAPSTLSERPASEI